MILLLLLCAGAALAAPATYDQRQDGDFNVRADVQNVVFLVAIPSKTQLPFSLDMLGLLKDNKNSEIQERADIHVMDAFVEPPTPYHVEIGESTRSAGGEVVIAARRGGSSVEAEEPERADELKLLGATEQCGPGRSRDPASMTCEDDPEAPGESPAPETPPAIPEDKAPAEIQATA